MKREHPVQDIETLLPYGGVESKQEQVCRMFNTIAPVYDGMNRLMTFGLDRRWRKRMVALLREYAPRKVLDIATGTGDLPLLISKTIQPDFITGIDLSEGMLAIAREKCEKRGCLGKIVFERQDCLSLTFPDGCYDAVTVAFGVRNFQSLQQGFSEMFRVLAPDGILLVMELSTPRRFPLNVLYPFYAHRIIPFLGRLFSRDKQAYTYLPRSIEVVPQGEEMLSIFRSVGFVDTCCRPLTGGVCTLYIGRKV